MERIEIVRGQAGALYGSDAQAGVINIITKKSLEPSFTLGFNTGTRQLNNYYHWDSGKQGKVSAVLDMNFGKLRNFDSRAEGFSHGPWQSYALDLAYAMDEANKLNLYLDYTKQKYDFEAVTGSGMSWDNHRDYERKTVSLAYEGHSEENTYSLNATYGELKTESDEQELVMGPGMGMSLVPRASERKHKLWSVEARNTVQFNASSKGRISYFANEKKNAITYQDLPKAGGGWMADKQFVNIDEASTKGVELAYERNLGKGFTLFLDYAYLDARNEVTGERLNFSARNTYTAKLLWAEDAVKPWSIALFNRWYSDYRNEGKAYSINTLNVAINKKWGKGYRAFIAIDNLFDKKNESINAYGRLWRAGAELSF